MVRVFDDSKGGGRCRSCSAPLDWYETVAGKKMPMEAGSVPVRSEHDDARRLVLVFDAADSHWANCPEADKFKRGR